ncbi:ABC transporter permease [Candidatus Woesearchaeota archaeon]|nr:ABC transporter permease [Candidatus Woesearchaeota archaeon]
MMIGDYFRIALGSIKKRKMRSWLTLIGIFIGIAAVVSLISIGQGLQAVIEDEFKALGTDKIVVRAAGSSFGMTQSSNPLTKDDVDVLKNVQGVNVVGYSTYRAGLVEWGKDDFQVAFVVSVPSGEQGVIMKELMGLNKIIVGRELRDNERRTAFISYNYGFSSRYDTLITPGRKITVNGVEFQVVGIKQSEGNEADDNIIYLNEHDFDDLFDHGDEVSMIVVQVLPGRIPADVLVNVEEALRRHRDVKFGQEDFEAETFENILDSFLVIFNVVQAIIIGIASISLFVGGVGIMNTMYTAVLERTKEIGIMKAIGARNSDIQNMFLIESGLLGLVGGLIGVLFGFGISKLIEFIAADALGTDLLKPLFPVWLIVGSLFFAFVLGSVSGWFPAKQAAKMNPVDALSTE